MKKLLLILLVLISFSAMSQTRPPIVTNELQTNILKWNDLLMYRDSLVYFRPVSETSFQVKRPSSSVWSTYDFTEIPDSFYVPDLDIWIVVGQPITQGDSTFYVRQKPSCPNCWQYSYDNTSWLNWFCAETGASNLSIDYNADDILGIHYNKGLGAYTDSLYFKAVEADSGKVPTIVGDSVLWRPIPRDSLFDAYSSDWLNGGDTIPIQKDSIFYGDEWQIGNVIVINDTSKINELDTIIINGQKLGNLDSIEVDPSVTNELDSIFVLNVIGSKWRKNGDSINIYFPYLDGVDPQMQPSDGDILTYNYSEDYWTSTPSQRDTLIINGVKYGHLDSVKVDSSLWLIDSYGIKSKVGNIGVSGASSEFAALMAYGNSTYKHAVFGYAIGGVDAIRGEYVGSESTASGVSADGGIGYGLYAQSQSNYSGVFNGGLGLKTDKLTVGSGATITRSGTIASKDIWTGTAAEFSANTVKDGITPQASTTIAFILN